MSKKQLLTESEIRRFMKYANLEPLSENFLSETGMGGDYLDEGGYGPMDEEEGMGEMPEDEMPEDEMPEDDDMGDMGDEPAPTAGGDAEAVVADALAKLAAELKEKLGVDISIEGEPAGGEEIEMGDEEGEEMPPEEGEEEAPAPMDEARMVSEVARRVMARLSESRRPQARPARAPARRSRAAAINEVTDRIMKRILKGK
jgi:hypothetical protein